MSLHHQSRPSMNFLKSDGNCQKVIERWSNLMRVVYTEFRNSHRVRENILALKVTRGELRQLKRTEPRHGFLEHINRNKLRIEIGDDDHEVWLWPVAIRAPRDTQEFLVEFKSKLGDCRITSTQVWDMCLEEDFTGHALIHWTRFSKKGCGPVEEATESTLLWYFLHLGIVDQWALSSSIMFLTFRSTFT